MVTTLTYNDVFDLEFRFTSLASCNITDTGYFARRLEEGEVENDTDFIMTTTAMVVGVRRVNDNNYPIIYIHWPTAGWMCGGFAILGGYT